jgi:hypothetical protein
MAQCRNVEAKGANNKSSTKPRRQRLSRKSAQTQQQQQQQRLAKRKQNLERTLHKHDCKMENGSAKQNLWMFFRFCAKADCDFLAHGRLWTLPYRAMTASHWKNRKKAVSRPHVTACIRAGGSRFPGLVSMRRGKKVGNLSILFLFGGI